MQSDLSNPSVADQTPLNERQLSKLKWRCRRGLLENDLFIQKFFERYGSTLNVWQAEAMERLMDLPDNDLLDLLLSRKRPEEIAVVEPDVIRVLDMLKPS